LGAWKNINARLEKIMSITTKTGDGGTTGRFGGARISKDDIRICAIGTVDELNSAIGLVCARKDIDFEILEDLKKIQAHCFTIGAELSLSEDASKEAKDYIPRISEIDVSFLEHKINKMENLLSPQRRFILPGGSAQSSMCFWIRSVARRAERVVVRASNLERVDMIIIKYLNRLSDYFFVLARVLNQELRVDEIEWKGGNHNCST